MKSRNRVTRVRKAPVLTRGKVKLGRDERIVEREKELMRRGSEVAGKGGKAKTVKVGRSKVEVRPLQPAQAAEIAAKEEEVRQRKVENARKRILEREMAD